MLSTWIWNFVLGDVDSSEIGDPRRSPTRFIAGSASRSCSPVLDTLVYLRREPRGLSDVRIFGFFGALGSIRTPVLKFPNRGAYGRE
jgi:hypothetical protein